MKEQRKLLPVLIFLMGWILGPSVLTGLSTNTEFPGTFNLAMASTQSLQTGGSPHPDSSAPQLPHAEGENQGTHVTRGNDAASLQEKIILIEKSVLAELNRQRHRTVNVPNVAMEADSSEMNILLVIILGAALLSGLGFICAKNSYFGNLRLGVKLTGGFGAVLLLTLSIGLSSFYFLNEVNAKYDNALGAVDLDMMASEIGMLQSEFIIYGMEDRSRGELLRKEILALLEEFEKDISVMKARGLDAIEENAVKKIGEAVVTYARSFADLNQKYQSLLNLKEELEDLSGDLDKTLAEVIHGQETELGDLETNTVVDPRQLKLQTEIIETLMAAQTLIYKISHNEVAFLLDKHIERVAVLESTFGELHAIIATVQALVPQRRGAQPDQMAEIRELEPLTLSLENYQKKLSEIISNQLVVDAELINLSEDRLKIEVIGAALGKRMDHDAEMAKSQANTAFMVLMVLALMIGSLITYFITRAITRPIGEVVRMIEEMEKGHLDTRLKINREDEIGQMAKTMDTFAESLQLEVVGALERLANGDLTFEVEPRDGRDIVRGALKKLGVDLNCVIAQIQVAGEQIASGSVQVSDSSQNLSQGATEQASSLEEITASMTEMGSQTKQNAENATQANRLSSDAKTAAEEGNARMKAMVMAMGEINESSQSISRIIKVIDEIAFQTNLLALNAAVEAARAGQHGKGFAVVAEEVRNLAARSATAARETAELIEGSVQKAENGRQIADQTANALEEIFAGVTKVTDLVAEIAAASKEQEQGIAQVNQGLDQVDRVTQQNTASAEQSAAAAEELSGQAEQLRQMLQRFKLNQHEISRNSVPLAPDVVLKQSAGHRVNSGGRFQADDLGKQRPADVIALDDSKFGRY